MGKGELIKIDAKSHSQQLRDPNISLSGHYGETDFFMGDFGQVSEKGLDPFEIHIPRNTDKEIVVGVGKPRDWHRVTVPEVLRDEGVKLSTLAKNSLRSIRYLIRHNQEGQ